MSDAELRDLLARVVPEPPAEPVTASRVREAGRRSRRRRTTVTVGAAAIAVVTAVAVPVWLANTDEPREAVSLPSKAPDAAPVAVADCPVDPNLGRIRRSDTFPTEGTVMSARLCDVIRARPAQGSYPTLRPPSDVLSGRYLGTFLSQVDDLPAADPDRCAAFDYQPSDATLQLEMGDGSTQIVRLGLCADVRLGSIDIDGLQIADVFLEIADQQRDHSPAPRFAPATQPICDRRTATRGVPIRPDREQLQGAVFCATDGDAQPRVLDPAQIEVLQAAWEDALPGTSPRQDICPYVLRSGMVVASDEWGDTIVMRSDACGTLTVGESGTSTFWYVDLDMEQAEALGIAKPAQ